MFWSLKHAEYIPNIILSCSKHLRNIYKKFFSSDFDHQNSLFWLQEISRFSSTEWTRLRKKWLPDLWGPVKTFLGIQHPWCGYLKHSPRSGLSNARSPMSVRHTQTKRHRVFWFTWVWKYFFSLKKPFSAYCCEKSTKITKMWFLQVFWGLKQVKNIPNINLSCPKHLRNI